MENVLGLVRRLNVTLRVARAADAEIALRLDVAHKLCRIVVVVMRSAALRNVAAQRENILDAALLVLLEHVRYVLTGGGYAGQMRQNGNVVLFLEVSRDIDGVRARAAACAVGNAHEIRVERRNLLRRLGNRLVGAARLGRKYFEGKSNLILLQKLRNLHIYYLLQFRSEIAV